MIVYGVLAWYMIYMISYCDIWYIIIIIVYGVLVWYMIYYGMRNVLLYIAMD